MAWWWNRRKLELCHSEERSDEESQSMEQLYVQNRDSSLLTVAHTVPKRCPLGE